MVVFQIIGICTWTIDASRTNGYYSKSIGKKEYELKDHLGNVRVTVSDRKNANSTANLLSYTNYYAFGTELTGKSYNPTSYTFGYNGKMKDDEVFGVSGGFYDFGERGLDMRGIPSPFTPDPYQSKYPQLSPYLSVGNSPILFVDNEGEENIIYLYDLRLNNKNLSPSDKQKIIDKMYDIAYKANSDFQKKQLPPRVVVIENEQDYTKLSKSSDILQKSDVLATIGNTQQNSKEQEYLQSKGYDYVKTENVGPGESSFSNDQDYDSKGAVIKNTEGDRISINLDITPAYAKTFGVDENTLISKVIQHESVHNAGIAHNNEKETFRPTTGLENVPDMTTSANYFKKNPALFGKMEEQSKLFKIQNLFTRPDGKFTKNPAKDNIFNKKIKYNK